MINDKDIKRGNFIVFEGIDDKKLGEQISNLKDYFYDCLKEPSIIKINTITIPLEKITAAYFQLVEDTIQPLLNEGITVIAQRYTISALVYNLLNGRMMDELLQEYKTALMPDITFYIDTSYSCFAEKSDHEKSKEIYHHTVTRKQVEDTYHKALRTPLAGYNVKLFNRIDNIFIKAAIPGIIFNYKSKGIL